MFKILHSGNVVESIASLTLRSLPPELIKVGMLTQGKVLGLSGEQCEFESKEGFDMHESKVQSP